MAPTCFTCKATFEFNAGLASHCQSTGHIKGWVCQSCQRPLRNEEARRQHTEAMHPSSRNPKAKQQFPSGHCNAPFKTADARNKHIEAKHMFKCRYCTQIFTSADDLHQHDSDMHYFPCEFDECDRACSSQSALDQHTRDKHSYWCYECEKRFASQDALNSHDFLNHNFSCKPCQKVFRTITALEIHRNSHPYRCPKCTEAFLSDNDLQQHIDEDHTSKCDECQATFEGPKHLEMHKKYEHNITKCSQCESCHHQLPGISNSPFEPFIEIDSAHYQRAYYQSITSRGPHRNLSFEELRLANYAQGLKYKDNSHRTQCHKCPKSFIGIAELVKHVLDNHMPAKPAVIPQNNEANGGSNNKAQLECLKSGCNHQSSTVDESRDHHYTCNKAKCDACDGLFDKRKDPELQAHKAKFHTPKSIFKCNKCIKLFGSSDAVMKHYSAEHEFVCEACPGTFFINSATRDSHVATCGILLTRSDSGDSFLTSRTEFSPVMQRKTLPTAKVSLPLDQPLIQFDEEPKIENASPALSLVRSVLAEVKKPAKPTFQCRKCDAPPFDDKEKFDTHMKYSPFHGPPQLVCYECDPKFRYRNQIALLEHLEKTPHHVKWVLSIIPTE